MKQAFVNNNIAARPQYADGEDWPRITVSASDRGKNGSLTITRRGLTGLSISQNDDRISRSRHRWRRNDVPWKCQRRQSLSKIRRSHLKAKLLFKSKPQTGTLRPIPPRKLELLLNSHTQPCIHIGYQETRANRVRSALADSASILSSYKFTVSYAKPFNINVDIDFVITAKIEDGNTSNFPILQGLKRQEQLGYRRKMEQRREQQQRNRQDAMVEPPTQAMRADTAWQDEPYISAGSSYGYASPIGLAPSSTLDGKNHVIGLQSSQVDSRYLTCANFTQSQYTDMQDRLDVGDAGVALAAHFQFPTSCHYPESALEAETYVPQGSIGNVVKRAGLPHPAERFSLDGGNHRANRISLPSQSTRMSLPSTYAPQTMGECSQSRALSSSMNRVPSASLKRRENGSNFAIPRTRINRTTQASPYFQTRTGSSFRTHASRALIHGKTETSSPRKSPLDGCEWSTLPGRKALYSATPRAKGKEFHLPRKLFEAPDKVGKAETLETSQRSGDSATEVVLPLRRPKLTLFQPSPPKLGGNSS